MQYILQVKIIYVINTHQNRFGTSQYIERN